MNIRELEVKNYRSLVNTQIEFKTNLTALIGTNGAGKTNILHALMLLKKLTLDNARYRRLRKVNKEYAHTALEATFESGGDTFKFLADIYFDVTEENDRITYCEFKIKITSIKNSRWINVNPDIFSFMDHFSDAKPSIQFMKKYMTKSEIVNNILFTLNEFLNDFKYYSATEFSDPTKAPVSIELEDGILSRSYRSRSHERFIYDLFSLKNIDPVAYLRYVSTVGSLGLNLINDVEFAEHDIPSSSIKVKAGGKIEKINIKRTFVIPSFTIDSDLQLSPNQLSEGTFKTLALIFYIMNEDTNLLLIEEPEVCVHHGLLGDVIELIKHKSKNKQIVISTHSDYVMDRLKPDNIVIVRKTNEGTTAETLNSKMSKKDIDALHNYLNETGNLGEYWKESGYFYE